MRPNEGWKQKARRHEESEDDASGKKQAGGNGRGTPDVNQSATAVGKALGAGGAGGFREPDEKDGPPSDWDEERLEEKVDCDRGTPEPTPKDSAVAKPPGEAYGSGGVDDDPEDSEREDDWR